MQHPRPNYWKDQDFKFPNEGDDPNIFLDHLATFPSQLSITIQAIPTENLTIRVDEKWSIQEHVGHLIDLEDLPTIRVKEIISGQRTLTPADMQNEVTWKANYNDENMFGLCEKFMQRRMELVQLFRSVPKTDWNKSGFHERLNRPMSILDLAYFQCQHDQYHHDMIMHLSGI